MLNKKEIRKEQIRQFYLKKIKDLYLNKFCIFKISKTIYSKEKSNSLLTTKEKDLFYIFDISITYNKNIPIVHFNIFYNDKFYWMNSYQNGDFSYIVKNIKNKTNNTFEIIN